MTKTSCLPFPLAACDVNSNLPFIMLTRAFRRQADGGGGRTDADATRERNRPGFEAPLPRAEGLDAATRIVIDRPGIETKNVVGVLEGAGPQADETVVIGGHYDHLGHGGLTSGSLAIFSSRYSQRGR